MLSVFHHRGAVRVKQPNLLWFLHGIHCVFIRWHVNFYRQFVGVKNWIFVAVVQGEAVFVAVWAIWEGDDKAGVVATVIHTHINFATNQTLGVRFVAFALGVRCGDNLISVNVKHKLSGHIILLVNFRGDGCVVNPCYNIHTFVCYVVAVF